MYTESDAAGLMLAMGIPQSILGFKYIKDALMILEDDPDAIHGVMVRVYAEVAGKRNTTTARAEKAIRHAIGIAWQRGDPGLRLRIFGNSVKPGGKRPANSEFLAACSGYLESQAARMESFAAAPAPLKEEFLRLWELYLEQKNAGQDHQERHERRNNG